MNTLIWIVIIGAVIYFLYQKNKKSVESEVDQERIAYFDKKYQKRLISVNSAFERIQKLNKLSFDLLNMHLIKFLIEENPKRYDEISARHQASKSDKDEYEEWVQESKNPRIVKVRLAKELLSKCSLSFTEIFQLWEKAVKKHIKNHTETELELYLDDMQGACIYYDALHNGLSKDKIIKENKSTELLKRLEDLDNKLNSILTDSQERFFEG